MRDKGSFGFHLFFFPLLELFIFVLCRHQNINNDKTQQNFFKGKASDESQIERLSWLTQVITILGFLSCQMRPLPRQPSLSSCLCRQHSKQRCISQHISPELATRHHYILYMQAGVPNREAQRGISALGLSHITHVVGNRAAESSKHGFGIRPGFQTKLPCYVV